MDEPLNGPQPAAEQPAPAAVADSEPAEAEATRSRWLALLKLSAIAVVIGLLGLLVWATLQSGSGQSFVAEIAAGKNPPAPAFHLPVLWRDAPTWPQAAVRLLNGDRLALADLRGRPVVVNFWASWCIACREEAPILHASAQAHAGKVVFLGVDVQDLTGEARAFARKYGMNYGSVRDESNSAYYAYGLTGVPETYYLDARGRVIAHTPGPVTRAMLAQGIAAASR